MANGPINKAPKKNPLTGGVKVSSSVPLSGDMPIGQAPVIGGPDDFLIPGQPQPVVPDPADPTKEELRRSGEMKRGSERAREIFGIPGAGGPDERASALEGETPELIEAFERRRGFLEGLSPQEQQAFRAQIIGGIGAQTQSQLRSLRGQQAGAGIRGGLAGAQRGAVVQQGAQQQQVARQNQFLQEAQLRREGLSAFEASAEAARKRRFQEALAVSAGGFGEAALGASERGAQIQLAIAQAQASANQGGGGGGKF